jgi:t-SNARE complex subunit (syntaxin)
MAIEDIDQPVSLAQLLSEAVHALQGALEVRERRVKEYIIVFLIIVIMRILLF